MKKALLFSMVICLFISSVVSAVIAPTVSTMEATNVEGTSATLRGMIVDDGGEACEYRFVCWVQGEPGTHVWTSWTGSVNTGESFSQDISGLNPSTVYDFSVQAKNTVGWDEGETLTFITLVTIELDWVTVGNPGNLADSTGYGSVSEVYRIGKYEVTAGQYTEFLNAVAATDTYGLYNTSMWSSSDGCKIERSSSAGSYTYSVAQDWADRPVNYVSWYDCLRFCNWLHNGQPTGPQDAITTEDGAYDMSLGQSVVRDPNAWVWLPDGNEWYKAAYHKNDGDTGNYFIYPTSSDTAPGRDALETTNAGNNANYYDTDYLIGSPYYRTVVGEFELSVSPYGTFDQGGNVWEWNETRRSGWCRFSWGGTYFLNAYYLSSLALDYCGGQDFETPLIGFRVASVLACPSADLTNDCFVDLRDLAKVASQWLTGIQ